MSERNMSDPKTLRVSRKFQATPEKLYRAWTEPSLIARWFGPEGFSVSTVESDLREGGHYKIVILSPNEEEISHFGEYVKLQPYSLIVFTWVLANQACQGSDGHEENTLVTIELLPEGKLTRLNLVHEKLPDQKAYDGHQFGWQSSLESLSQCIETL